MMQQRLVLEEAPLGQVSSYVTEYTPSLLYPIPRKFNREQLNIEDPLPFHGVDIWNAYELSWLNSKGKPQVVIGEFSIPCTSPNIVESKSLKLYLNSLNQSMFNSVTELQATLKRDLSSVTGSAVIVKIVTPDQFDTQGIQEFSGMCLDDLDVDISIYEVQPQLLKIVDGISVKEAMYSRLLKSNCPKTGQPDWATVSINYSGPQIDHRSLLKYLVSLRNHQGFHEETVERIFMDLMNRCKPDLLTVYARYTRRGGIDINPFRSNFEEEPSNIRNGRQ